MNQGDIIGIIYNAQEGSLYFSLNNGNYLKGCDIPADINLSPCVLLYFPNSSVELLN